jgi:hypothetical protein
MLEERFYVFLLKLHYNNENYAYYINDSVLSLSLKRYIWPYVFCCEPTRYAECIYSICMAFSNLWSMRDTHIENMVVLCPIY